MLIFRSARGFLAAFVGLALIAPAAEAASPETTSPAAPAVHPKPKMGRNETAVYVDDMHCKTCAKKVARKLYAVKGVVKVRTNVKSNLAIVTPQRKKKLDPLALWKAAKASGFPAVKLIGPDGTYVPDLEKKGAAKLVPERTAKASVGS